MWTAERTTKLGSQEEATHPDVLEVLAVDGIDDAVGANELDSTIDVDVYHSATLTVLGREKEFGVRPPQKTLLQQSESAPTRARQLSCTEPGRGSSRP